MHLNLTTAKQIEVFSLNIQKHKYINLNILFRLQPKPFGSSNIAVDSLAATLKEALLF